MPGVWNKNRVRPDSQRKIPVCDARHARLRAFELLSLRQDRGAWPRWRSDDVGASDAPVIMGDSPWMKADELRRIAAREIPEPPPTAAMLADKQLEGIARAAYSDGTGVPMTPACLQSLERPWIRASLDGLSSDGPRVVEIKCPGERDHALALGGQVPRYSRAASARPGGHDCSADGLLELPQGSRGVVTIVRDDAYIERPIRQEEAFRNSVFRRRQFAV